MAQIMGRFVVVPTLPVMPITSNIGVTKIHNNTDSPVTPEGCPSLQPYKLFIAVD